MLRGEKVERLQKRIATSGFCSRRKAEEYIKKGKVKVNGEVISTLGAKVSDTDIIEVDGNLLEKENLEYYLLNKPRQVVTTTNDEYGRKTVCDLIPTKARIYPVGRLDYDTTGVLLLTNDGEFANILMHPKEEIDKVYIAKIQGIPSISEIQKLKEGVLIDKKTVRASKVKIKKKDVNNQMCILQITIHDGINHQVKRMIEAIGYSVLKLKREKEAFFTLEGLPSGTYRKLTKKEVFLVYSLKK